MSTTIQPLDLQSNSQSSDSSTIKKPLLFPVLSSFYTSPIFANKFVNLPSTNTINAREIEYCRETSHHSSILTKKLRGGVELFLYLFLWVYAATTLRKDTFQPESVVFFTIISLSVSSPFFEQILASLRKQVKLVLDDFYCRGGHGNKEIQYMPIVTCFWLLVLLQFVTLLFVVRTKQCSMCAHI